MLVWPLYLLFFFSGMAGLICEVAWTRMFGGVFGNTTHAISAVLSSFMAGLALGSLWAGRFIDRRADELRIYGLLEVGIGLSVLAVPLAIHWLDGLYGQLYQQLALSLWALQLARTLCSFAVLLVPTFLMGATLPVLSKFAAGRNRRVEVGVGLLYGLNTLGAGAGCFLSGFVLIEHLGVQGSTSLAAGLNLALGALFLLAARWAPAGEALPLENSRVPVPTGLLLVAGLAGFTALGYEVLWSRLLVFKLRTTVYAFAIMLTTFLVGLGMGSALLAALARRWREQDYHKIFGWLQLGIGLCGLVSVLLFGRLESWFSAFSGDWSTRVAQQLLLAATIMLVPALLMGAAFPALSRAGAQGRQPGRAVGLLYAANTLGAVCGPLLVGFVLVQALGTQQSLVVMALLNLSIAAIVLRGRGPRLPLLLSWLAALVLIAATPGDLLLRFYNAGERELDSRVELVYAAEDVGGITTVHRLPNGERTIATGSTDVAGTSLTLRSTQKLQAHIPMLLHPGAKQVLQIGFGSGETAHLLTGYPIDHLDVAEISRSMLETAARFFPDLNHGVAAHPRFRAWVMDGANYLRLTGSRYDAILNDSIWPFYAGNSGLYTREYFQDGRERLRPGGLMTSWLPLDMQVEDFKIILKTFHVVFPYFSVWFAPTHYNKHALLVGSAEPLQLEAAAYLERFARHAQADLAEVGLGDPVLLLDCFATDQQELAGELEGVAVHTADRPLLEFSPSRATPGKGQVGVYEFLSRHRKSALALLEPAAEPQLRQAIETTHRATGHVLRGLILREQRQAGSEREFALARQLRPDHPGARAIEEYEEQLYALDLKALDGRTYDELLGLAARLGKAGLHEKTAQVLEQATHRAPEEPRGYGELGLALLRLGRAAEAVPQFERARALDSDQADTYNNLGNALRQLGKQAEAASWYRQALERDPELAEAYYNLGMLHQEQGQAREAIGQLAEAVRLRPDYVKAHINLGILLDGEHRLEEAIAHFQRAVALAPDEAAYHNLVIGLTRAGRIEEAQQRLEEATARQLDLPAARQHLVLSLVVQARAHAAKGEWRQASQWQRQAVALTPAKLQPPLLEQLKTYEAKK